MNIFKNIFKKTHIYKFFNTKFLALNTKIDAIDEKLLLLEESNHNFENKTNNLITNLDAINSTFNNSLNNIGNQANELNNNVLTLTNIINERTKQFEYINTELLLLNNNEYKSKILIVGFYGAPNSGDELMLQSILNKIDSTKYSVTVMLADNPNYNLGSYKNINFIHYPKTKMDINIISNYFDKIVFGGGAIIDDSQYTKDNSYQYDVAKIMIDLSISSILKKKKVYCIGLSSSKELTNKEYISNIEFIIDHCNYFSLRDSISYSTLETSGIDKKILEKVNIIHDLVFSLEHIDYTPPDLSTINIGLVLIGFSDHQKLIDIITWIDEFLFNKNLKANINLIPFYDFCHSDIENFKQLLNNINIKSTIGIENYYQNYNEIANCFCKCNILLNMRYHSSLLCLKIGIPAIHLSYDIHPHYSNKMNFLKNTYSLDQQFLSYMNLNKQDLINSLSYILENSNRISLEEKTISKEIENEAIKQHIEIINKILEN